MLWLIYFSKCYCFFTISVLFWNLTTLRLSFLLMNPLHSQRWYTVVFCLCTPKVSKKSTSRVAHIKGICVDFVDSMKKSVDLRSSAAFFQKIFFVTKTISEGHWPLKVMKTTKSVIFETRLSGLRARGYTPLVWCFFCKFKKSVQCENACEYFLNYG